MLDDIKIIKLTSAGKGVKSIFLGSLIETGITNTDFEFGIVDDGHPFKTEVTLDLWGFGVTRKHKILLTVWF